MYEAGNTGKNPSGKPGGRMKRYIIIGAFAVLAALLALHLMRDRGPRIDPDSPAAQLARDDSGRLKEAAEVLEAARSGKTEAPAPRLFTSARVESGETVKGEWRFSVRIEPDEDKCRSHAGNVEQCRQIWSGLNLAPETWKTSPRLPLSFKTHKSDDAAVVEFSAPAADLPDPEKYKKLIVEIPRLSPLADSGAARVEAELPPWTITPKVSRVFPDPESPSSLIIQATLESSRPLDRASVEKRLRFLPEGEGLALGKPQIRWSGDYSLSALMRVISLPLKNGGLTMALEPGAMVLNGAYGTARPVQSGAAIPSRDEIVGLASLRLVNLRGEDEVLRPLLMAEFTLPVRAEEARASVAARLLPLYRDKEDERARRPFNWSNMPEIPAAVLESAPVVELRPEPADEEYSAVFAYRYSAPAGRWLYIEGSGGLRSRDGHILQKPWAGARRVPPAPRELRFMQEGNILALSGTRKLALMGRGLDAVEWRAYRARPEFISLLAGKSASFAKPDLNGPLEMEDISDVVEGRAALEGAEGINPQYAELDLGKALEKGTRGIFQIDLQGMKDGSVVRRASRFVLLTDLGLIIKKGVRGERGVFVTSLAKGGPAAGAEIRVIGRNGVPVVVRTANQAGRADLPDLEGFVREKEPVAIEARLGADMTYMKLEDSDSRMRTGFSNNRDRMSADGVGVFVFSERGVYRPGETIRFGLLAKDSTWKPEADLPPLSVVLHDPMERVAAEKTVLLSREGLGEATLATTEYSPTGRYNLSVRLGDQHLGSTHVQVEDFQPDRIRVRSRIFAPKDADARPDRGAGPNGAGAEAAGRAATDAGKALWLAPEGLRAEARVENLYGAPVRGGQVRASYSARRATADFITYQDFSFFAPAAENAPELENEKLSETATDDNGVALYDLPLNRLEESTYALSFTAEGFESGGGRSVISRAAVLVSPFERFIGWRAASRLNFLARDAVVPVELIALGRQGRPVPSEPLILKIAAVDYKSVLVRIPSGAYRYETQRRSRLVKTETLTIPAEGLKFNLPTDAPGEYEALLEDERGVKRNGFSFTVAGAADRRQGLRRDATLRLKLDKEKYNAGEEMKVFISAPYAGAGLITLESDRVLAHKWFHASSADSVQTIAAPEGFEGRGFLMAHMLRDLGSGEIHANPYSQGMVPFLANMDRRDLGLALQTPDKVVPGETMAMTIKSRRPGKALVFAVDEGVLQLTSYSNPSPLNYFLRDKTHEVEGMRNWHLLMPEYGLVRKASAFGGGISADALSRMNPFRRKGEDTAAYWSGLVDVNPQGTALEWTVPAYFNGRLRIMAVASGADGVGETAVHALANAPVIITPTLPVAVAPGDSFDVTVTLANTVEGSGKNAPVTFGAALSEGLAFESEPPKNITVDEGGETRVSFRLKAGERLGESSVTLSAAIKDSEKTAAVRRPVTLSVRPPTPRMTSFAAGRLKSDEEIIPVARDLYPQHSRVRSSLSALPLPLAGGLAGYLTAFPHGCTEQILSSAFPYVLLRGQDALLPAPGPESREARKAELAVGKGVQALRERRLEPGRYSLWPQSDESYGFLSVYALDYLLSAREAGYAVPQDLLAESSRAARAILMERPRDADEIRLTAYAAYVYTKAGILGYGDRFRDMSNLVKHCDRLMPEWRKDVGAALVAGAYSLLRQDKEAADLIKNVVAADPADKKNPWHGNESWFMSPLWANGLYLSVLASHFPGRLDDESSFALLAKLVNSVSGGQYTTTGAVQAIRGIAAYAAARSGGQPGAIPAITARDAQGKPLDLQPSGDAVKVLAADSSVGEFVFSGAEGMYWQIESDGFDRVLPPAKNDGKIELKVDFIPAGGGPLSALKQGDEVNVRVRARTTNGKTMDNVAITTLLPGGFEMLIARGGRILDAASPAQDQDASSSAAAAPPRPPMRLAHAERREDRMVLYARLSGEESEYVYRIKAVNKGRFVLPASSAEALYDPDARARTGMGVVEVR